MTKQALCRFYPQSHWHRFVVHDASQEALRVGARLYGCGHFGQAGLLPVSWHHVRCAKLVERGLEGNLPDRLERAQKRGLAFAVGRKVQPRRVGKHRSQVGGDKRRPVIRACLQGRSGRELPRIGDQAQVGRAYVGQIPRTQTLKETLASTRQSRRRKGEPQLNRVDARHRDGRGRKAEVRLDARPDGGKLGPPRGGSQLQHQGSTALGCPRGSATRGARTQPVQAIEFELQWVHADMLVDHGARLLVSRCGRVGA